MPDDLGPARSSMAVVPGIDALPATGHRLFVVVGVFDGLHLGHLYLLGRLRAESASRGAIPAVVTFDHHPDEILTGAAPALLCDPDERLERLEAAGVGMTIVQHFDLALRMTGYDAFIRRIAARARLAGILMTPDSAFGHERRGTPEAVAALGTQLGYDVVVIPPLELDGRPVRSAEIRGDIAAGDLAGAARLLGRPYAVVGEGSPTQPGTGSLSFPMPVALPPAGRYRALIGSPDGAGDVRALVVVRPDGRIELQAPARRPGPGERLRITFEGDGAA